MKRKQPAVQYDLHVFDEKDLVRALSDLENTLIEHRIGLIIIDSIAALARLESASYSGRSVRRFCSVPGDTTAPTQPNPTRAPTLARTHHLFQQAAQLKRLADLFNLVVLVTNQVTGAGYMDSFVDDGVDGCRPLQFCAIDTLSVNHLTLPCDTDCGDDEDDSPSESTSAALDPSHIAMGVRAVTHGDPMIIQGTSHSLAMDPGLNQSTTKGSGEVLTFRDGLMFLHG